MGRFPEFPEAYRRRWLDQGLWFGKTLQGYFDEAVEESPDHVAIVFPDAGDVSGRRPYLAPAERDGDLRISFALWKDLADDLAAGLLARGIGFEDIVTVALPNWPEMCLFQIALARIGAVIEPLHVTYREREIRSMLAFCESAAVVLPARFGSFDFVECVRSMRSELPVLREIFVAGGDGGAGTMSVADLIEEGKKSRAVLDRHVKEHPPSGDHVFYLNFTSGTEGDPKGFLHTHDTLLATLKRFVDLQAKFGSDPSSQVALANSPMTHSFGHLTTHQVIFGRSRMVLVEKFSPEKILRIVAREKVTSISGTPAHLISLLEHPDFGKTDVSSVKSVGVGGAQCPEKLMQDIERIFGVKTGNTYGMGENIVHTRTLPSDPPEIVRTTVGKPVPGAELAIFDDAHEKELSVGEVGEVAFRGPSLFLAYFKNPRQTAATRNQDGWFFTGDAGFVDETGYLHLVGRKKELINRGGTKIFPKEIEDLLELHPKVRRAAVVGMPDYRLGEKVCAYVVPETPGDPPTIEEVAAHLDDQGLSKNKFPERIEAIDEFPLTPTGKILKRRLAEDVREKVEAEGAKEAASGRGVRA